MVVLYDPIIIYNDTVILAVPKVVDGKVIKDKYGNIQREDREVPAHVRYKLLNYYTNTGEGRTSTAQVYMPNEEIQQLIDDNTRVTHTDPKALLGSIKNCVKQLAVLTALQLSNILPHSYWWVAWLQLLIFMQRKQFTMQIKIMMP